MRALLPILLLALGSIGLPPQAHTQSADPLASAAASGDWKRTEVLARAVLASNRRSAAAWTYLGLAQDHLGEKQQALNDFAEAVRLDPRATFTHNNYGAALEADGKSTQAGAEYRRSLAIDRNQPAALVNLARLLTHSSTKGSRDEARTLLQAAWQLAPDSEIARSLLLLAPCAVVSGPHASPLAELSTYAHAVAAKISAVPSDERPRVGRVMLGCGLKDDAEAYYAAFLSAEPRNPEAIVGMSKAQLAMGRIKEAGATLESAVAGGLESPQVYASLAQLYLRTAHLDHAVDAMQRALALAPQDSSLQFRYGMLLLDTHAPKAAELRMQQAVDANPRAAQLWFVLGLAQFDQTNPAAAQVSFDRAIALDPHFAPALAYRGLAALDQQHYAEAEQWYRKSIAADPSAADLHCLLAEALERQHPGELNDVRAELQRALQMDPNLATAYLTLGRLDVNHARPADAVKELETALRLDPGQRQAHFYLARAYRQLHDTERAATESRLFSEQESAAQTADRAALQETVRQLAHTSF